MNDVKNDPFDPLGLLALGSALERMPADVRGISGVTDVYAMVMSRYTALQDRYRLLKAAHRQLAEEVAWLRDQCDDFALEAEDAFGHDMEGAAEAPAATASAPRREG